MPQPTHKPTTFLTLPRELRQRILHMTITESHIQQDVQFNTALQFYDNTIIANILSHTFDTRTTRSPSTANPKLDHQAFDNFQAAYNKLRGYGIIPVHVVGHAEILAKVHKVLREDMAWVLRKCFKVLIDAFFEAGTKDARIMAKTRCRRQSVYVAEPFGDRRRVDKFTPLGQRSREAFRRGMRRAWVRSGEVWNFDG